MINKKESYALLESNIDETIKRLNDFCIDGFNTTHDWLEFVDRPSKTFEQLTFEKEYPSYKFDKNFKWIKSKTYLNELYILLDTKQHETLKISIDLGGEIIFCDKTIYVIGSLKRYQRMVQKIYI